MDPTQPDVAPIVAEPLLPDVELWAHDCLHCLPRLNGGSVDLILVDLPYGTTSSSWDVRLPFEELWTHWRRLLRPRGVVVLTGSQPFTTLAIMSNLRWFRCEWVWDKQKHANFAQARRQPLRIHENILVFASPGPYTYNPQMVQGEPNHGRGTTRRKGPYPSLAGRPPPPIDPDGWKYPKSILSFPRPSKGVHPTQKPVELFEYLIRTYSNPGGVVLDCCAGSGTTGEAALRAGRKAILMENDAGYAETIRARIQGLKGQGSDSLGEEDSPLDPAAPYRKPGWDVRMDRCS